MRSVPQDILGCGNTAMVPLKKLQLPSSIVKMEAAVPLQQSTHLATYQEKTTTLTGPRWTSYQLMNILLQWDVNESELYTCYSTLTLLTRKSFSSKCRPNIFGASPGMGSILMHTSCPFLALSTALWLLSMLVTTPKSTNWKNDTMKRQKTMKSSPNDIMEPEAFTNCQ